MDTVLSYIFLYFELYIFFAVLEAYIKTNFGSIFNAKLNKNIGCGSISDGIYKLEVHIINFNEKEYANLNLKKGDKIELIGTMQNSGKKALIMITRTTFSIFIFFFVFFVSILNLNLYKQTINIINFSSCSIVFTYE